MLRQIGPISALLLASLFLQFAGGINGLILPVRGTAEGFSAFVLGLLGTGWAVGYVSGCYFSPTLVSRVGHIRSFAILASVAGIAVLASLIFLSPQAWIPLRAIQGFCFAGTAMIVESWLSERAEPNTRGRIFGIYTMVNLFASTGGQMSLTLGDTTTYFYFVLAAMLYSLALVPTSATTTTSPQPLVSVRLNLRALWRNSPVAVFAVLMVGVSNSSFGTLAAVYAGRIGLELKVVALFTSIPILAGALAQIPIGIMSDRMDRRKVLILLAVMALLADLSFIILAPQEQATNLLLASIFGAAIYAMYPVIVAHANDHAEPGTYIQISGGLLMIYGIGAIVGPLAAGFGMTGAGPTGLFMTTVVAHVMLIGFALWRMRQRGEVAASEKTAFVAAPNARGATPETASFALGDDDAEPDTAVAERE
ncbi:MAG: MFS transporter [Rhodobacter sp.]|nr:MFS transporter [Rhodobacter sp.]